MLNLLSLSIVVKACVQQAALRNNIYIVYNSFIRIHPNTYGSGRIHIENFVLICSSRPCLRTHGDHDIIVGAFAVGTPPCLLLALCPRGFEVLCVRLSATDEPETTREQALSFTS
jgi:hypothetical protein